MDPMDPTQPRPAAWETPTRGAFSASFLIFAVAIAVALLGAELGDNLDLYRTLYAMAAAMLLALPALFLYALGIDRPAARNLWRLFWSFAFLAYAVHLIYALLFLYKLYYLEGSGPFAAMLDRYGIVVAVLNIIITLWWALDVVLAWLGRTDNWVTVQRILIQILVLGAGLVAVMPAAERRLEALAYLMVAAAILGLLGRLFAVAPEYRRSRW